MKYLKMLGLVAVAAMALTALLGTGSASATVLCKTYVTPCPTGWDYGAGTEIHATTAAGTTVEVRTTSGTVLKTCKSSTIKGKTTNTGSATETVLGNIEEMTFTECTRSVAVLALGTFEIHYVGPKTKGVLTSKGAKITTNTIFGSCTYGTGSGTQLGVLESDEVTEAELNLEAVLTKEEGSGLCPADAVWLAKYKITSPKPLYFKEKMD